MTELEINRVRELRKNPNRSDKIAKAFTQGLTPELVSTSPKVWLFRLIAVGGTLSLGATLSVDEVYAQSCRTGINITRAHQGVEALLIGRDPRTGREIVRLNYPADRLKEGSPVDSTTGRYELEVTLSTATGSKRYFAPCGQAVNIPLEQAMAVSTPGATKTSPPDGRPPRPDQLPPWVSWVLGGLGGLIIGGAIGGAAGSASGRKGRTNAENQRDQALTDLADNEATTQAEVSTLQTELQACQDTNTTQQARITQLENAMNAAGVPIPPI